MFLIWSFLNLIKDDETKAPKTKKASKLCIAVCVKVKVKAMSSETIDFSLVWNMPRVSFVGNQKTYNKYLFYLV